MGAILECPPQRESSLADLGQVSQTLAEQVSRFPLRNEGFAVSDYLSLGGGVSVEYVNGCLQVLPMADALHQAIVDVLHGLFKGWLKANDAQGRSRFAPFPIYLTPTIYREPDVCVMLGRHAGRRFDDHWDAADLVVEIVSESNRSHDEVTKRAGYAAAGIPEYWIIDPVARRITVLSLQTAGQGEYAIRGEFHGAETVTSGVMNGFSLAVNDLFAQAEAEA